MAEADHGMFAAEFKAGKTWAAADLAVSVASGTPWLGIFEVDARGPVLLFAGEGESGRSLADSEQSANPEESIRAGLPIRVCLRVPHLTVMPPCSWSKRRSPNIGRDWSSSTRCTWLLEELEDPTSTRWERIWKALRPSASVTEPRCSSSTIGTRPAKEEELNACQVPAQTHGDEY